MGWEERTLFDKFISWQIMFSQQELLCEWLYEGNICSIFSSLFQISDFHKIYVLFKKNFYDIENFKQFSM